MKKADKNLIFIAILALITASFSYALGASAIDETHGPGWALIFSLTYPASVVLMIRIFED